jgi:hypothetical protein
MSRMMNQSLFFFYLCNSIFVSAVYNENDLLIINFPLAVNGFFSYPRPRILKKKNGNSGYKNMYKKNVSHLAPSCLL